MLGSGNPPLHRFRVGVEFAVSGHRDLNDMIAQHSAMARRLAEQLGLPESVQEAVGASYEQWDGKGWPGNLRGDAIPIASRLAQIGEFTEVAHRIGGIAAAVSLAEKRAGSQFDPELAATFCTHAEVILDGLDAGETWDAVIGAEPSLGVYLSPSEFDTALLAIADFVDLKSPYMLGHARGVVGARRRGRGEASGSPTTEVALLRRAGVVHGLGRLGVSNAIWDKRGTLGAGEWERVRMHPYLTERMLSQSEALAPLGAIAVAAARAARRLGLSPPPLGRGHPAVGSGARRRRRLPGHVRATPASRRPQPRAGGSGAAGRGEGRAGWTATRSRPCSAPPAIASLAAARARPVSRPARSTCCASSPGACPARRSRRAW